jgi:predicted ATPase
MRQAIAAGRASGEQAWVPYYLAATAETCSELGRLDEALELVTEALDLVERTGERWYEAELYRLGGEFSLLRDSSPASVAERSFRTAIEVARKQEAKSLELRSATSLARLLAKQGKRDEARTMLADIYNWFTEGFDTADLKDARALLDELNG